MKHIHFAVSLGVFLFLAAGPHMAVSQSLHPAPAQKQVAVPEISRGIDRQLHVPVGPPSATIAAWVLEPAKGTVVRGTVLFLHGFMTNHLQVQNAGEALRRVGYRAVLVDLRGFGESTDETPKNVPHYTFGKRDANDMKQLTDFLQHHGLCGETVGVYGTSYGAAAAILFAAIDPRVSAAVAVAPFATIRDEVPSFSRMVLGSMGNMLNDSALNKLANVVSDVAAFDLDGAKPLDAIVNARGHILLIHGDADTIVPHAASEELHDAAPEKSELLTIPHQGHLDLCFDPTGLLREPTEKWFERFLP